MVLLTREYSNCEPDGIAVNNILIDIVVVWSLHTYGVIFLIDVCFVVWDAKRYFGTIQQRKRCRIDGHTTLQTRAVPILSASFIRLSQNALFRPPQGILLVYTF